MNSDFRPDLADCYPVARKIWNHGGVDEQSEPNRYAGLLIHEVMSTVKAGARHKLRQAGFDRLRAYQQAMHVSSSTRGFHKSSLDAGFELHDRKGWRSAFLVWKREHEREIAEIERILDDVRKAYTTMGDILAGQLPAEDRGEKL